MPNFIEIGGVTRTPLVDLTRNDPNRKAVRMLSSGDGAFSTRLDWWATTKAMTCLCKQVRIAMGTCMQGVRECVRTSWRLGSLETVPFASSDVVRTMEAAARIVNVI